MKALFAAVLALTAGYEVTPACIHDVAWASRERLEESRRFEPGGTFRLDNVNGTVTIDTWDESRVLIEAEKLANSDRGLERIEIEIEGEGDEVVVKSHLPRRPLFFGRGGKVDYHIRLPHRARLQVETVNGKIEVTGIKGRVRASTVNGSVEIIRVSGEVETSTVNGSIKATYRQADPEGHHRFSTTNGSVSLYLPSDASGEFDVRTVNGGIRTDFPLQVEGRFGNKRLHGRLGDGHAVFEISTVNGSVRIREATGPPPTASEPPDLGARTANASPGCGSPCPWRTSGTMSGS